MEYIDLVKDVINNLGFPIAMVGYFIWDKQKTMQPLIDSINNMNQLLAILCDKLDLKEVGKNE